MSYIQIEQVYDLSNPTELDDFQIGKNKIDPLLDQVAIKKIKYKKDLQYMLAKIPVIIEASRRCGLVPPLGYYQDQTTNTKEFFMIYKKYTGSYAELKAKKIQEGKNFTKEEIQAVINGVLHSLKNLHKKLLFHGNIKLTNILYLQDSPQVYLCEAGYLSQKEKNKEWFFTPEEIPGHEYFTEDPEDLDYQQMDTFQFGMVLVELVTLKSRKDLECLKYDYGEMGVKREELFKELSLIIQKDFLNILKELLVVSPVERKKILQFDSEFFELAQTIETGPEIGTLPRITNADIDEYDVTKPAKQQTQEVEPKKVMSIQSLEDIEDISEDKQINQQSEQQKQGQKINNEHHQQQQQQEQQQQQQQNEQIADNNSKQNHSLKSEIVYEQDEDFIRKENEVFKAQNVIKLVSSENMGQAKSLNSSVQNNNLIANESQILQKFNDHANQQPQYEKHQSHLLESEIIRTGNSQIGQHQKSNYSKQSFQNKRSDDFDEENQINKNILPNILGDQEPANEEQNNNQFLQQQQQQNQFEYPKQQVFVHSPKNGQQYENEFTQQLHNQENLQKQQLQGNWTQLESFDNQNKGAFLTPDQGFDNIRTRSKKKSVGFAEDQSQQGSQVRLMSQASDLGYYVQNQNQLKQSEVIDQSGDQGKIAQFSMGDVYSSASQQNARIDMKQIIAIFMKCIQIKQIDILDVFVYYDQDYDYTLDDPNTLNKILTILGLLNNEISEDQSFQIFQQYSFSPKKMSFLGLVQQLVSPKQLLISLLINILKINRWTILQLFEKYQNKDSSCWGLKELIRVNDENRFRFDESTLKHILNEFLDTVDSQDKTLNSKELAQILGFRIQTPNEMIIRSINQRMHSQIKRLTEIQLQDLIQKQREQELERQLQIERQKREKILQQIKEREEKELQYKLQQEKKLKEEKDYLESKKFLPSIANNTNEGIQVNKQMFWKTLGSTIAQTSFDPIMSRRQDNHISSKDFYRALVEDYEFTDCLELREFVDNLAPNRKINITKLREKLKLSPDALIPDTKDDDLVLPDDMIEEIKELFKVSDRDGSGTIEKHEIENLLKLLGINAKDEELDYYFKKYDKDGDKNISFKEFQIIMTQQIYNQMLSVSDIIDDLKTQFKRVDINNTNSLQSHQLNHVLNSLGIMLKEEELQSIFNEIDQDKSGSVELNEFLNFIKRDLKKISGHQASTIIKIRSCRKPRISELQNLFMELPHNYILSFTYGKIKNGFNLPSLGIKPKMNGSSGTIKDLFLVNDPNIKHTLLKGKRTATEILAEISLSQAMCIPLPKEKEQMDQIKLMEVVACLFDKHRKKFLGNSCRIEGFYQESKTQGNCWSFGNENEKNSILVKYSNYNEKRDSELVVCFEFILHYKVGNKMVIVSAGFSEINLSDLKEVGKKLILINGGDPYKQIPIDWLYTFPPDQMQNIKSLTDIKGEPCLKIYVSTKVHDEDIASILPGILIMNTKSIYLYKAFREYLADFSSSKYIDAVTLREDLKIKSFLAIINCPDTEQSVASIWEQFIHPHIQNDVKKEIEYMSAFLHSMSGMIANKQFGYNTNDPTKSSINDSELSIMRKSLLDYYISDLLQKLQLKEKETIKFPIGKNGGQYEPPEDDDDEEDQLLENDDVVRAKTINLQSKKGRLHEEDEQGEEYKESITGDDYLFLFTTEDIKEEVFQKVTITKILLIDFREQISRGKYSLAEVEQIAKGLKSNRHLKSLYLKLSLSSYDEDIEKIKLAPLLTALSNAEVKLRSLYLHLDYNDLSVENACYKLIAFLKSQRSTLQNLNLNLESTNLTYQMGKDLSLALSQLTFLQNLNLNVSLNQLGPDFVECLAKALKNLTNMTCLKLDLEKIEMKEFCLSCYCGYYFRICLQFIPFIGACCMWTLNFYTALEHVADAISCMDKLQYLNLNIAQNNLGDRLLRHFEYKFGKALYTRPNLTTLILNFKRNKFVTKSIKSISTLGISSLKVDLRYNYITEEGLQKIGPSLYSLRNLKNLSIMMEGNKKKELLSLQSQSKISTENNNKQSQIKSGPNSELNSLQNSRIVNPNNNNSNFVASNSMKNSQMEVLNNMIDYNSHKYYENKILKSITGMPQIEHIEISGLGGIHGKSNQNSIISNKFPAIKQMYLRAKRKNLFKYQIDQGLNQNYSIPIKHIFNEDDDIDTIISLFCNSQTLDEIHLQFLYDSQVLRSSLNLRYFNPIIVIDYSDCVQLEQTEIFTDFIALITKNQQSVDRIYVGGIQFQEQQLQTLSRALHKIIRDRGKPLSYFEYSHFNLYREDNASKPSYSFFINYSVCEKIMLSTKDFFSTFCDFKEEVFKAQEEQNLIQIQNYLPDIAQVTQILTVRNLITLSYYKDQKYIEVKNFDQDNIMEFRLFELLQGLQMNDIRSIVVRDKLAKEGSQVTHLNQINHLNDQQFSSFMRCDLKRNFPFLENLEVVFAPSPNELPNCLKSLSIKLLQNERKLLKKNIIISHEQQKDYEEEIDKDPIEKELIENKGWYLFYFNLLWMIFLVASVLIPFIFEKDCGEGHNYASHIIFSGVSVFSLFIESSIIKYWIIPNQRPKLLTGRDKSWRRRLSEHFKNQGDLYILLLISLVAKFDMYANFLFITITHSCDYTTLFIIALSFIGTNFLFNFSQIWYLTKYVLRYSDQPKEERPYLLADVFSQLTNFLNMSGISYLMDFKEVKVALLFSDCWMVPVNMCFTLLKLIFDNFPMIVLKIIFLIDKKVNSNLEQTSVILSAISSVVNAIIFGLILIKKFEEFRYTLKSKGSFGFINYERKELEDFLGKPRLSLMASDEENKEVLDKSIIEEEENIKREEPKQIEQQEEQKQEEKEQQENDRRSQKSIQSDQNQENQPLNNEEKKEEKNSNSKEINANQDNKQDKQIQKENQPPVVADKLMEVDKVDDGCCSCCCCCGPSNGQSSISKFFSNLFTITIKDFSFFYEKAIQDMDISIRFRISIYKFYFWIASVSFYALTYILPFYFYDSCEEGISHKIFYIFIGICFFITILEYKLIHPLVKNMYEIPRKKYNDFPFSWVIKLIFSLVLKAHFMVDLVVLIYGKRCYEKNLIFNLIFISLSIVFWLRAFKQLRYLLKPLRTDTLFPVITRFTILADLCSMMLLPKLVYPYLPERRITRLKVPDNLLTSFLRFVLQDFLMVVLNIIYLIYILTDEKENGNIFEFIIVSLSLSVISAFLTIKWWSWPLKMNKQEDLDRLFLRNDEIVKQTTKDEQEYNKVLRHSREFCCCLISRNGCVSKCFGLD